MKTYLYFAVMLILLAGCSKPSEENQAVKNMRQQNEAMSSELEKLKAEVSMLKTQQASKTLAVAQESSRTNDNPPNSVKEIVAYSDASGNYNIYFILSDKQGEDTSFDGEAEIQIKGPLTLWKRRVSVKKSDFRKITRGRGAFKSEALAYVVGQVSKYEFDGQPSTSVGEILLTLYNERGGLIDFAKENIVFKD